MQKYDVDYEKEVDSAITNCADELTALPTDT